jgi:hypothetical protein
MLMIGRMLAAWQIWTVVLIQEVAEKSPYYAFSAARSLCVTTAQESSLNRYFRPATSSILP